MHFGILASRCCGRTARQRICRSSRLGIPLCEQRTGIHILTKSLNIAVWLLAKLDSISLLDRMDPKSGNAWRNKKPRKLRSLKVLELVAGGGFEPPTFGL